MHAAELVWILDVNQTEEQLLKGMRKTTRYLVRKAQTDGVEIIKSDKPEDLEIFNKIYEETARRQHFMPYSEKFLKMEFAAFSAGLVNETSGMKENKKEKDEQSGASFFFAKYNDEIVSAAMILFSGESAFYHQGASSGKYPKIPAPHLLQWEIIREAKKRGLRYYNFWGIAPEDKPKHPWAGLSLFKKVFLLPKHSYLSKNPFLLKQRE